MGEMLGAIREAKLLKPDEIKEWAKEEVMR